MRRLEGINIIVPKPKTHYSNLTAYAKFLNKDPDNALQEAFSPSRSCVPAIWLEVWVS